MSYTLELSPELEAQLQAVALVQHKNETDILLAAVQEYLRRQSITEQRWAANIQNPDSEAWLDAVEQEGWLDATW
jgi:predicted transcriptional regulator